MPVLASFFALRVGVSRARKNRPNSLSAALFIALAIGLGFFFLQIFAYAGCQSFKLCVYRGDVGLQYVIQSLLATPLYALVLLLAQRK